MSTLAQKNKRWGGGFQGRLGNDEAYDQALADAFYALKTITLLMHPAVPKAASALQMLSTSHMRSSLGERLMGPKELAASLGQGADEAAHEKRTKTRWCLVVTVGDIR